ELRLIDPSPSIQHRRTILPPSAFAAVNIRLLRKPDGTGVILVPDAAAQFSAGEYRILMTYRRDNRANAPTSTVLSESGDHSPEHVLIDVPWKAHATAQVPQNLPGPGEGKPMASLSPSLPITDVEPSHAEKESEQPNHNISRTRSLKNIVAASALT